MRHLIISVLIFITTSCFAIDQKLIDGAKEYDIAAKKLREIEIELKIAEESPGYWAKRLNKSKNGPFDSPDRREFFLDRINESNEQIKNLSTKYAEAKKLVKRLEPIKKEYNQQAEKERKRENIKTAVLNIGGILGIPILFFISLLFFSRKLEKWIIKRNKKLLKEGKLTQKEYNQRMQSSGPCVFSDRRINPATGLPMTGATTDVGGNVRGSSDYRGHDYLQEYRDRHRWDDHNKYR